MSNMDDYYRAANQATECTELSEVGEIVADNATDSDELETRNDIDAALDRTDASELMGPVAAECDAFCHFLDDDDAGDNDDESAVASALESTLPIFPNSGSSLSSGQYHNLLSTAAQRTVGTAAHLRNRSSTFDLSIDELQRFVTDTSNDETEPQRSELFRNERPTEVVQLIASALDCVREWSPPLRPYASIEDVSRAFTLNERQHAAFTLIATSLLQRFLRQELGSVHGNGGGYSTENFEARFRDDQLLMFIGGAGGTGKSRVIDAVDAFCASWLRLDKLMRRYKHVPGVPFGGVHIVLVGDFLQMPPVKADPIYLDPAEKTRKVSTADIEGFELWRKFTTVIILDESVRFREDPEWGEGCRLARLGQWTPEFIELINSRVLSRRDHAGPPSAALRDEIGADAVFVTPENATRLAVNNAFMATTAKLLPTDIFPVRVTANFKGVLNVLGQSDLRYVMSLPDNRFGRMAPYLDIIDGMPVQVTQNVATAKGIANGTLGTLEFVHFPASTGFRLVRDGASNTVVQLPSQSPDYAILRVPRPQSTAIRPGLDPELFPVFFTTEAYMKSTITLPKAPGAQPRSITVKPQQLPFVCAVGSTVYKVQGETLQSMIVMDWKAAQRGVNKPQQPYLLVSRVTSRNAFIALTSFTHELAAWAKPPASRLKEEERLNHLSNVTLATFQSSLAPDVY